MQFVRVLPRQILRGSYERIRRRNIPSACETRLPNKPDACRLRQPPRLAKGSRGIGLEVGRVRAAARTEPMNRAPPSASARLQVLRAALRSSSETQHLPSETLGTNALRARPQARRDSQTGPANQQ